MASTYYGVNRGVNHGFQNSDVTVGAATGSTDIEIRIDNGKSWTRMEVSIELDRLKKHIEMSDLIASGAPDIPPN
jgi:hypothetical protein